MNTQHLTPQRLRDLRTSSAAQRHLARVRTDKRAALARNLESLQREKFTY